MRANENLALAGKLVRLVPYTKAHVPQYHAWMEDPFLQEMTASEPLSLNEEYAMQASWQEDSDKCTFIIESLEDGTMVGDVNLFFNDPQDPRAAEIEVMIAEQDYRRRGFGREALSLMMSYGCQDLGVTRFVAKVALKNEPSLRLFESLGFLCIGTSQVFQESHLELIIVKECMHFNKELLRQKY
jgi:RimJ/RimL family protein N-acetyltransferase